MWRGKASPSPVDRELSRAVLAQHDLVGEIAKKGIPSGPTTRRLE